MINQLTIYGVGLIGGSLAKSLREQGYCKKVVGCSRKADHLQQAVDLDIIDEYTLDPVEAAKDADVILLAVPLGAMEYILKQIKDVIKPGAVITDAGSAKGSVVAAVESAFGFMPTQFVPGHPIAGREKSGVTAAIPDLYVDRKIILTPLPDTNKESIETIRAMWEVTGAVVEMMTVEKHDKVLAATSHLPHLLAFGLVDTLSNLEECEDVFHYAAGGFRDFTRIASSDPVMWRDICVANHSAILDMLDEFKANLDTLTKHIEDQDAEAIINLFSRAKSARDRYVDKVGS